MVILVLGEAVTNLVSILAPVSSHGFAILFTLLIILYNLKTLYFESQPASIHQHAMRRKGFWHGAYTACRIPR